MCAASISLDEAVDLARTGDVWLFRGRAVADRAIQVATNSPVNHVGMSVVIEDLPPLMWHAELGRSLPDAWTGARQRGVQLHDLRDAVSVWAGRYGQRAWLRQRTPPLTADPRGSRRQLSAGVLHAPPGALRLPNDAGTMAACRSYRADGGRAPWLPAPPAPADSRVVRHRRRTRRPHPAGLPGSPGGGDHRLCPAQQYSVARAAT